MTNLDEAIQRFEKLSSDYEFNLDMHQRNIIKLSVNDIERMERYAQENRQLAEWLKKLQAYDEGHLGCQFCEYENRDQLERPCSSCCRSYKDNFKAKKEGE